MPQGMFQFKLIGCDATPVTMSVTWPTAVHGLSKWGKATSAATGNTHFAPNGLAVSGITTAFTVQDGQLGDNEWAVNGEIVDPVGPTALVAVVAVNPAPVSTLGQWALVLLSLMAVALGQARYGAGQLTTKAIAACARRVCAKGCFYLKTRRQT